MLLQKLGFTLIILFSLIACSKEEKKSIADLELPRCDQPHNYGRQDYWDNFQVISSCEALSLTFFIDPQCGPSGYSSAMLSAVEKINAVESSIHLKMANSIEEADIFFNCTNGMFCGGAIASPPFQSEDGPNIQCYFPSGGSIGGQLDFHINWEICPCTGYILEGSECIYENVDMDCVLEKTVLHEIGHAIGIAHNGQPGDFGNPTNVPGTPDVEYSPTSVFNAGYIANENCDWCDGPCEFDENDIEAIQFLYPFDCTCIDNCTLLRNTPSIIEHLCFEDRVCFGFDRYPCLQTADIVSSSSKVAIHKNEKGICFGSIATSPEEVIITITPLGHYGALAKGCDSEIIVWEILVNDNEQCRNTGGGSSGDPNHDDPNSGGGPAAEDCLNNGCPCETASDCPPGWKCIGLPGNKFCIPL